MNKLTLLLGVVTAILAPSEKAALQTFWLGLNGPYWQPTTWNFSTDPCASSWMYLSCGGGTSGTNLESFSLPSASSSNNISGTLADVFDQFPYMTSIGLGGSPIKGSLPLSLGKLKYNFCSVDWHI